MVGQIQGKCNFIKPLSGESNEVAQDVVNFFKEKFSEIILGFKKVHF
jgi:hypothetical protein